MNVLFTASTLPRFADDMQPPFVLHQAQAWKQKRPDDQITILAPDDPSAARLEQAGDITILIEPINDRDVPGYHLSTLEQAAEIVARIGRPNLKIMADCYHIQIMGGDLVRRLEQHLPMIGHIQFAAVPSRGRPDEGELNYPWIAGALTAMGYDGYLGAEYRPEGMTDDGLGWMAGIQSR